MTSLNTTNPLALRLLFADELYLIGDEKPPIHAIQPEEQVVLPTKKDEETSKTISFDYLGENNKYILLIVSQPKSQYLDSGNLEALKSVLAAKKQELRDVAILNLANYPGTNYKELKEFFACGKIVLFGIDPAVTGFSEISANKVINVDGLQVLATYSFEEMLADTAKKRIFWNEMKEL